MKPPAYSCEWSNMYVTDALEGAKLLKPQSVHSIICSPPYWGLRSYLSADDPSKPLELGTEPTPEAYVEKLVEVFRALWDVLRDDGTLWLNLGSSYNNFRSQAYTPQGVHNNKLMGKRSEGRRGTPTFKEKDLIPISWLVGLALQRDGWHLRADNIWSKPNPMPSSVTDRPTISHEYMLMFSKKPRYFFDQEAVREKYEDPSKNGGPSRSGGNKHNVNHDGSTARLGPGERHYSGRNIRSVWTIAEPKVTLRHDLTEKQRSYVVGELLRRGWL